MMVDMNLGNCQSCRSTSFLLRATALMHIAYLSTNASPANEWNQDSVLDEFLCHSVEVL